MANINRFESDSVYSRHTDRTKIISIASGKGGVGKSTITANLALQLSHLGNQVLILDGDFGMSNIDILFNHRSKHTIMDFFDSELRVEEIAREIHPNIQLISGGSGIYELRNLDNFQKRALMDEVTNYSKRFDFLLIDTSPGIDDNVLYLNAAADEILVIINPDPASITDSYALIKVLNQRFKTLFTYFSHLQT